MFQVGVYETAMARMRRTAQRAECMGRHDEAVKSRKARLAARCVQVGKECRPAVCCTA